jgi:hypothetical protein
MKQLFLLALSAGILLTACNQDRYLDLNTGKRVELVKDENTGMMVNKETKEPVDLYVDLRTNDTIYGATGEVVNGYLIKTNSGKYEYDDDHKRKVEEDEAKIKTDDKKVKTDDEERKEKNDN